MAAPDEELLRSFSLLLSESKNHDVLPLQTDHITKHRTPELCLTAKLFCDRSPNLTGFKAAMLKSWAPEGEIDFIEAAKNTYLLVFQLTSDKWRTLKGGPWSFNRDLLVLSEFTPNLPVQNWHFSLATFSVQFHGLPLEYHTQKTATDLVSRVGSLADSDPLDPAKWSRFIRARVEVDVLKPLTAALTVALTNGDLREVDVKYERLPRLCVFCGLIGHELRDCAKRASLTSSIRKDYPPHLHHSLLETMKPRFANLAATPPSSDPPPAKGAWSQGPLTEEHSPTVQRKH